MLKLQVHAYPDCSLEVSGAFGESFEVCGKEIAQVRILCEQREPDVVGCGDRLP